MRLALVLTLAVVMATPAAGAQMLARGNGDFVLGWSRADVDSAVAARGLTVMSSGSAFLVCAGDEKDIEYEQYAFLEVPHGKEFLWKVTIGYRLDATPAIYAAVRDQLVKDLGAPQTDTWQDGDTGVHRDGSLPPTAQHAVWADPYTAVQLGARWTNAPDRASERMIACWTERRLQRLVEARRRKPKPHTDPRGNPQ